MKEIIMEKINIQIREKYAILDTYSIYQKLNSKNVNKAPDGFELVIC